MGFKDDLEKAEKNMKVAKPFTPEKIKKEKKVTEEDLKKAYIRGRKDMNKLRESFSKFYCKQVVFVMGLGRKSEHSDPTLKAYCDGFVDVLEET
jgi:hypothetical protein